MVKTAVVTGGAKGIGKKIVEGLLESNYTVLIVDYDGEQILNTLKELSEKYPDKVKYIEVNLTNMVELKEALEFIQYECNNVNLLVNNAGVFPSKHMLDITEKDWDEVHDLNLKAVFFFTQGIVKIMIKDKVQNGSIINVTSTASEIARPGVAHYSSSKSGLKMLTQVLALELAEFGIRVNGVGPGLVETDSLKKTLNNNAAIDEHNEKISQYPFKRLAKINEITNVVLFIASEKASYISGQNILVDGAYSSGKINKNFEIYNKREGFDG